METETLEFEETLEDLVAWARYARKNLPHVRRRFRLIGLLIVAALAGSVLFGFYAAYQERGPEVFDWLLTFDGLLNGVPFFVLLALAFLFRNRAFDSANRRAFREQLKALGLGERYHVSIRLEAGELVRTTRNARQAFKYPLLTLHETKEHIFLQYGPGAGIVVPKRAFENEEVRAAFLSELRRAPGT